MPPTKIEHSVEETTTCGCFPAYRFTIEKDGKKKSRLVCRTYPFSWQVLIVFAMIIGGLVIFDKVAKDRGMAFSLDKDNPYSIKGFRDWAPLWMKALMRLQTPFGGGVELVAAMVFALIFFPRSRFFYYMTVSGLE